MPLLDRHGHEPHTVNVKQVEGPKAQGALFPNSIKVRKQGMPASSQATSSQSIIADFTGMLLIRGRSERKRFVMSAPLLLQIVASGPWA